MHPISVGIILLATFLVFGITMKRWYDVLKKLKPAEGRLGEWGKRISAVFLYAIGQKRLLKREKGAGWMHAFIFWGFLIVAIRTITLFGLGFSDTFTLPFLGGFLGDVYSLVLNIFELLVAGAVCYALYRRIIIKPARLTLSLEANLILLTIFLLMASDFFIEGAEQAMFGINPLWAPVGFIFAKIFMGLGLSAGSLAGIFDTFYFVHLILITGFLNFLPYGKHFHIITSLPNVFLRRVTSFGALSKMNLEDESVTSFGTAKLEDMTWKQVLDVLTCTECGRCQEVCPAHNSKKPLSPKKLNIDTKHFIYNKEKIPLVATNGDAAGLGTDEKPLSPNVIPADVIWSCTTCRACEEACPLWIEYVDRIVDMRRQLVLMQGNMPAEAQTALKNIENNSNPWGIGFSERANWCKDLNIKKMSEDSNAEYLYFVGCAGAFDDRAKKISRAFVKILQAANVSFGILGEEEQCNGETARRLGNEYLFQTLCKANIETFKKYNVKKILTTCPHCYNTLKNEYPQFDGNYEVYHHTQFINDLIKGKKIRPTKSLERKIVTFHDSCYLGRYNNIYNEPRDILKSIPGTVIKESENTKDNGRCCGAGGGRMWMEEHEPRVNHMRFDDLAATNAETITVACPFCTTMMQDSAKDKQAEEKYLIKDIAELVAESI